MRIIFLIRSLERGGAERQLCLLAAGMKKRGHQVSVAVFYPGGALQSDLESAEVKIHNLNKKGRWDLLSFTSHYRKLLAKNNPQIVYSFLDTPNLLAAWLKPKQVGLKVAWGLRASNMDLSRYDWFAGLSHRLLRLASSRTDLIIANSQAGINLLHKRGLPPSKTMVISNGIDTEKFRPDPQTGFLLRQEWGLGAAENLMVGLVARLDPMKDVPSFLRAASILSREGTALRFVCVGDGPEDYKRTLVDMAAQMGLQASLIWAGERRDMTAVMNALDLLVLSSAFGEGFPNVVGEAMACGKPCVVTDVGDAARLVGDNNLVVPPGDSPGLASSCREILSLPVEKRRQLGLSLRQRVKGEYSLEIMIEHTEQALAGLLER